ncbi:MAG: 2-amino-4-hydroxy-6-hydroxymethyldihydropteridine diphosphokinase [Desulfovibrio sp.]|nr:2-amino-4-hydroxy-6-hydroxymethyldihydropteridine diphosphokinase [Desulfovibrio sp.]
MTEDYQVFVSLGSNSGDAENMLELACQALARLPHARLQAASPVYSTAPQDYADQPWFLNQVVALAAGPQWRPCSFVDALLELEAGLGRVRSADPALRYGPRAIDADLLLFGEEKSSDVHCLVPHPRLTQRAFALVPLLDIAPDIMIDGISAATWLSRLRYVKGGQRISQ